MTLVFQRLCDLLILIGPQKFHGSLLLSWVSVNGAGFCIWVMSLLKLSTNSNCQSSSFAVSQPRSELHLL